MNENIYNEEYMRLVDDNAVLRERIRATARYVKGNNYVDGKTILLILGVKEDKCE